MEVGTDEQKARFLPTMASARDRLGTGLERTQRRHPTSPRSVPRRLDDGDDWVVTGQKIWASRAVWADWCFGIFRTDPDAERHKGLTFILVPLDSPGVTVRPIAQLDGDTGFAEIFFDDVRVPVDEHARRSRAAAGTWRWRPPASNAGSALRSPARFSSAANRLVELWKRLGDPADTAMRDAVTEVWMQAEGYRLHTYQTVTRMIEGRPIGAEASASTRSSGASSTCGSTSSRSQLLGPDAERMDGPDERWVDGFLFSLSGPIYAGTNEIQRNIIADRVLQLPKGL